MPQLIQDVINDYPRAEADLNPSKTNAYLSQKVSNNSQKTHENLG